MISVPVLGDTAVEGNETFAVNLSSPANATLAASTGASVNITNDDSAIPVIIPTVTLSSDKTTLKAGDTATLSFNFNLIPFDFTNSDIQLTGGTLGNLVGDFGGKLYTARFTPNTNANTWSGSVSVMANSYTDSEGTPGSASNTLTLSGDTLAPILSSSTPPTTPQRSRSPAIWYSTSAKRYRPEPATSSSAMATIPVPSASPIPARSASAAAVSPSIPMRICRAAATTPCNWPAG